MEKTVLVLLFVAVSCALAKETTPVKQCGSEKLFKSVTITTSKGICTRLPCHFKLGEKLKVNIEFENKNRVEKIVSKCLAKVLGTDIDFPVPDAENGCNYLIKGKCPASPNSDLEIQLTLPVQPPSFNSKIGIDAKLQFTLTDQDSKAISCFQLTAQVEL